MDTEQRRAEREVDQAVGLKTIADAAQQMKDSGSDDLEVNTFILGARRKMAEVFPDTNGRVKAKNAAAKYKEIAQNT
jgi:hypothetical protein